MKEKLSSLADLASAFGKRPVEIKSDKSDVDNSLVYSTDTGRIKTQKQKTSITASDGFALVRRETKGRKGKGVIVISGLGLNTTDLKSLASQLKKSCGTGGSVVDETIEIQGDKRELIKELLEKKGYKVKFTGG
jgi:translation initiation factor 1